MSNATNSLRLKHTVLVVALAAAYPMQTLAAASAGIAQFIAGDVSVRRPDGKTDPLVKGKDIESGEAIVTGATGRAQVRFSDGGLISLQPNTEFKIANYVDQADPKQDRFLVDLLRGSMRAITGLIGKRNRENYKVTTTTATIGIRGSGFSAGYNPDGSLGVTTELDAIEVCNAGGCVRLIAGESVRVNNSTDAPVRTVAKAPVPTPPPQQDTENSGNKTSSDGKAEIVTTTPGFKTAAADAAKSSSSTSSTSSSSSSNSSNSTNTPAVPVDGKTINTGTFTSIFGVGHFQTLLSPLDGSGTFLLPANGSVTLDTGKLTNFTTGGSVFTPVVSLTGGSLGTIATNDFIGWGNWVTSLRDISGSVSTINHLHYVVGQPTSVLPTTVGLATYALAGSSVPTSYLGISGTLNTATFQVNFDPAQSGGPRLNVNIVTSFGVVSENSLYFSNSTFASISGAVKGFFVGPNAARAGLIYNGGVVGGGTFTGAAVFQK
jgi:hypothetical protein